MPAGWMSLQVEHWKIPVPGRIFVVSVVECLVVVRLSVAGLVMYDEPVVFG